MANPKGSSQVLPTWLVAWLIIASPVVVWDFSFLLLRPSSLPGGDLHWLFQPYSLYIEIDRRYNDMEDTFGLAQAWMNAVEVLLSYVAVIMHFRGDTRSRLLAFMTLTMTWWKTVCYMIQYMEICNGGAYIAGVDQFSLIFLFLLPNGAWLLFPGLGMLQLYNSISRSITAASASSAGKKTQ